MPRGAGVLLHYLALLGAVALVLWLIVPRAITQVEQAVGNVPTSAQALHTEAKHSTGVKREILLGIEKRLKKLPSGGSLVHRAYSVTKTAFEVLIGVFFICFITASPSSVPVAATAFR